MNCEKPIILGGAGSSGSTLLITLLGRHREITAGPELSLLNKKYFFLTDIHKLHSQADRIAARGICTDGWFLYPRIYHEKYGFSKEQFRRMLKKAGSQKEFIDTFFAYYMQGKSGNIWAEKTPSNAYCFEEILTLYPEARIIHIYRDGRDVITSFIKRGMSPYYAVMLWLYNTAHALKMRDHPNYYELKYEDLVTNPEIILQDLCGFLGLNYDNKMLSPGPNDVQGVDSWAKSPTEKIDASAIHKYSDFLTDFHYYVLLHSAISKSHMRINRLEFSNAEEIHKHLGYDNLEADLMHVKDFKRKIIYPVKLILLVLRDMLKRYSILARKIHHQRRYPARIILKNLS